MLSHLSSSGRRQARQATSAVSLLAGKRSFSSTAHIETAILSPDSKSLSLSWDNGNKNTSFPSIWLRDHSPETLHPTSLQRQLDAASIDPDTQIQAVKLSENGQHVQIRWHDDKENNSTIDETTISESVFESKWLINNSFPANAAELQTRAATQVPMQRRPWKGSTEMGRARMYKVPACDLMAGYAQVRRGTLERLFEDGVVMVTSMPDSMELTEDIARSTFGAPRETFYGTMWDTAPKASGQVNDTAYSRDGLHPHTDTCYLLDSPGLQLFNCVAQAVKDDGNPDAGLTKLVDGFAVAERLKTHFPDTYEYFTTTPLRWHSLEDGTYAAATAVPIKLDPLTGMVRQFRYNTYDFAPLSYLDQAGVAGFYHHNRVMCELMRSDEFMTKVKLEEGEMIVIDNHRICHGRTAFTGFRNLVGCYIGRDDWESKLRVHGARLPEDL